MEGAAGAAGGARAAGGAGRASTAAGATSAGGKSGGGKSGGVFSGTVQGVGDAVGLGGIASKTPVGHAARAADKRVSGGHTLRGRGRHVLVAEFVTCLAIIALAPITDRHQTDGPAVLMRRLAATCVLFLGLSVLATAGKGATRIAAAFGGLVTVTLLVSDRDVLVALAAKFGSTGSGAPAGPPGEGDISQGAGGGPGTPVSQPQQQKG